MNDLAKKFDVRTPEGRRQATEAFDKYGWVIGLPWVYWKVGKAIVRGVRSLTVDANVKEIEAQKQTAAEIIRLGKEQGVDELEITMSQQAGIGFKSPIEGTPIEFNVGTSGTMTLKVKYKE
jgi:hypothetical protein